jgi:uncharacterized protein
MQTRWIVVALLLLPGVALAQGGAELSPERIIERMTERTAMGFDEGEARFRIVLQARGGATRERDIVTRATREGGARRQMIRVLAPADDRGTALLLIERPGSRDDIYLHLPAFQRTRRIAGSQKNGSFMGTDFTYADLENRDVQAATYEKKPDQRVDGVDCYRIVATPTDDDLYGRLELWIRKDNFLAQQIRYYDTRDRLQKVYRLHDIRQVDGRWVASRSQMWTTRSGHSTFLYLRSLDVTTPISAAELSPERLPEP